MKLIALLLIFMIAAAYAPQPKATITVSPSGYAQVYENATVVAFSPLNITLIGKPVDLTATYSNGSPVLYTISNENLTVIPDANGTVDVSYFTSSIIGKNSVSWFINMYTPYETEVILPPNASLISISSLPSEIGQVGESLFIILSPGNWTISYAIPPPSVTKTTTTISPTTTASTTTTTALAKPSSLQVEEIGALAGAVVIVAAASAYVLIRRRNRLSEPQMRELDAQIISFLKSRGGSAKESEIRKELVVPKTTAWRAIKRLEREGKVRVVKVDRENVIYLM